MMMNRQERLAIPKLTFYSKDRMESRRDVLLELLNPPTTPPPSKWRLFLRRLAELKGAWQTE